MRKSKFMVLVNYFGDCYHPVVWMGGSQGCFDTLDEALKTWEKYKENFSYVDALVVQILHEEKEDKNE